MMVRCYGNDSDDSDGSMMVLVSALFSFILVFNSINRFQPWHLVRLRATCGLLVLCIQP